MANPRPNPYVGPRSFKTGERLYGRERETNELLDLLIAERVVLLYSPSGAGKTSLIQAALLPRMRDEGFNVLPTIRVSIQPPSGLPERDKGRAGTWREPNARPAPTANRFVLSAMLSLEEALQRENHLSVTALADMNFDTYLKQRRETTNASPLLVFDQFEEILTLDSTNLAAKQEFFDQIGEALRDRTRWALFSMREDYLAGLDPYLRPIPTRFSTTFRLDLLGIQAAREAITGPARANGVDFTDGAASKLVDDMRRVQVQRPDGTMESQAGPYVEPVQLQVVCYRLWDRLPADKTSIVESDVAEVGDVNTALADYYATTVKNTVVALNESERVIREWFDRQLITEQGIRGQVLMEPERSRGLSNRAIRMLEDAHLVRADERRGATWFELSHDRLIEPIRANNAAWFGAHLSALQQQADLWNRQGRQDGLLLRDKALDDAEHWAKQHTAELTPIDQEFLDECRSAQATLTRERRQNRRIRFLAIGATALSIIALLGICVSLVSLYQLGDTLNQVETARAAAVANEAEANRQKQEVARQERVSQMTAASLSQLNVDPEVSMLLATEAYSSTQSIQTDDALRQAVAESRLRATWGGDSPVWGAAFSPDGKRAATSYDDGTVILRDASTGQILQTLTGAKGTVWSVAFSPDGNSLAAAGDDRVARLWDLTACNPSCAVKEFRGHTNAIFTVSFSPDGASLATASVDQTARLWDVASGQTLHLLSGHQAAVNSAQFSPDGTKLVTASTDQSARVWDLTQCNPDCAFTVLTEDAGALWFASYSPDGQYIVTAGNDQTAIKYDASNNNVLAYFVGHNDTVYSVHFSPDGKYIVTGSRDGTARVWDSETGQVIAILRGHEDTVNTAVFSPDGQWILTASPDRTAKVWNATNGIELKVLRGNLSKVYSAAFSPDGTRVVTAGADHTVRVWEAATGDQLLSLRGHEDWVYNAAFSPDGKHIVTASQDGTARVWDLDFCKDECDSQVELKSQDMAIQSAAFSPDGKQIVTAGEDQLIRIWNAATGEPIGQPLAGHQGIVFSARFSPDGKQIVSASQDGTARVWDAASGSLKVELKGHTGSVLSAAFSPDGKLIVTASDDRTARIWDASNGKELQLLEGHTAPVSSAAFSPDGKQIVTASSDKTARLWDVATGNELGILRGHTDKLWSAAFSPDGKFIVTASSDRTARIALAQIQDVLALARTRATRDLSCREWETFLQDNTYCPSANLPASSPPALPTTIAIQRRLSPSRTPIDTDTPEPPSTPEPTETPGPTETPELTETPQPAETDTPEVVPTQGDVLGGPVTQPSPLPSPPPPTPPPAPPTALPATPTRAAPTNTRRPAPTPTPAAPSGVYALDIRYAPIDANERPLRLVFTVKFLNSTGTDVNYTRWLVAVFRPGETKSFGDVKGSSKTVKSGDSELSTDPYRAPNVGGCESYVAKPFWDSEDTGRTPFLKPDGTQPTLSFQICP